MIISHSNKFVYTRPMKVGSTSIQHMLHNSNLVNELDISLGDTDNVFDETFLTTQNVVLPETKKSAILHKLRLLHSTPEQLYYYNLLSNDILNTYTFIVPFRNPIERFMSAWVMEVIGGYFHGDSFSKFTSMLEIGEFPRTLDYATPKDYLYIDGVKLNKTYLIDTKSIKQDLSILFPNTSFKYQHFKRTTYPTWYKDSYKNLDKKYLNIIKSRMADEIIFYESQTGETV